MQYFGYGISNFHFSSLKDHLGLKLKLMNVGSFLYTGGFFMSITKCLKINTFDEDLSSGEHFFVFLGILWVIS